jgi:hypothetical protein
MNLLHLKQASGETWRPCAYGLMNAWHDCVTSELTCSSQGDFFLTSRFGPHHGWSLWIVGQHFGWHKGWLAWRIQMKWKTGQTSEIVSDLHHANMHQGQPTLVPAASQHWQRELSVLGQTTMKEQRNAVRLFIPHKEAWIARTTYRVNSNH